MSRRWRRRLQFAAVCSGLAAYAGLSHYCNSVAGARNLGTALALTPLTVVVLALAWRGTPAPVAFVATAGVAALLLALWPLLIRHFSLVYLVEESGMYCLLGATFGRSVLAHRVPLCTHLADRVHGPLSAQEVVYTRHVTIAWTIFFFAVTAVSIGLFVLAPRRIWSMYINFGVPLLIGLMFVAEYGVRRQVLPGKPRAGLLDAVRAYFASPP